ncbi:hypothetical protein [Crocosphaera sp. Alani8]
MELTRLSDGYNPGNYENLVSVIIPRFSPESTKIDPFPDNFLT